jgi:hypothetical protein
LEGWQEKHKNVKRGVRHYEKLELKKKYHKKHAIKPENLALKSNGPFVENKKKYNWGGKNLKGIYFTLNKLGVVLVTTRSLIYISIFKRLER